MPANTQAVQIALLERKFELLIRGKPVIFTLARQCNLKPTFPRCRSLRSNLRPSSGAGKPERIGSSAERAPNRFFALCDRRLGRVWAGLVDHGRTSAAGIPSSPVASAGFSSTTPRRSPAAKLVAEAGAKTGVELAAAKVTVPMFESFFCTLSTVSAVAAILV
jgi:hypothetical protein